MFQNLPALRLDRGGEIVAVIMAECKIREDHRHLLAQRVGHERRHRLNLAFHIGDARLQRIAVQHAAGHVMPLGHHKIGQLQLARARGRADHHMRKQGTEPDIAIVLGGKFLHHLGAALGIGAIILGDDLHRAPVDAAPFVDQRRRGGGGTVIPAPVGRADPGAVHLETDTDRRTALRPGIARPKRQARGPRPKRQRLHRLAPGGCLVGFGHGNSPLSVWQDGPFSGLFAVVRVQTNRPCVQREGLFSKTAPRCKPPKREKCVINHEHGKSCLQKRRPAMRRGRARHAGLHAYQRRNQSHTP